MRFARGRSDEMWAIGPYFYFYEHEPYRLGFFIGPWFFDIVIREHSD